MRCGHPRTRLLYVTPEYCSLESFRRLLRIVYDQREISRIAVDEAHCISEWGHDFRPTFKNLDFFRRELPDVPIICCTATATPQVQKDIISALHLNPHNLKVFTTTTSRPNLHYEVRFKSDEQDQYDDFLNWLKAIHKRRRCNPSRAEELKDKRQRLDNVSGIIYTLYRKDCEVLAARLRDDGIGAKPFHAGLSNADKENCLKGWVENREGYDVVVATTAFGMGIDKDNVRFVVHWQIPKSFEGFYQEAGRAGRDGKASVCAMYYSREDRDRAAVMLSRNQAKDDSRKTGSGRSANSESAGSVANRIKSFQALVSYCENTDACRHRLICGYFGESATPDCDYACDWCKDARRLARRKELGLASEEWCSSQMQSGAYAGYDGYD